MGEAMRRELAALAALGLTVSVPPAATAADYGSTPILGIAGPEDMEMLPDGKTIVIGQFRRPPVPGGLSLLDTSGDKPLPLPIESNPTAGWGEPGCTAPPHIGA